MGDEDLNAKAPSKTPRSASSTTPPRSPSTRPSTRRLDPRPELVNALYMRYSRMHLRRALPWTTALVLVAVAVTVSDAGDRTIARTCLSPYLQPELYREGGRKRAELQHCCSYRTRRRMRCDMMRLRGGRRSEPAIDRLNKYHIKFPLGMQLYEVIR